MEINTPHPPSLTAKARLRGIDIHAADLPPTVPKFAPSGFSFHVLYPPLPKHPDHRLRADSWAADGSRSTASPSPLFFITN